MHETSTYVFGQIPIFQIVVKRPSVSVKVTETLGPFINLKDVYLLIQRASSVLFKIDETPKASAKTSPGLKHKSIRQE